MMMKLFAFSIFAVVFLLACAASAYELPDESKEYIDCLYEGLHQQLEQIELLSEDNRNDHVLAVVNARGECAALEPEYEYEAQSENLTCQKEAVVYIWKGFDDMVLSLEQSRSESEVASLEHLRDTLPILSQIACYPSNDLQSLPLYKDGENRPNTE